MMDYKTFLKSKEIRTLECGIDIDREDLNRYMFDFQKDLCRWALKKRQGCDPYRVRMWEDHPAT